MTELIPDGFATFYESVWSYEPFEWQADLAEQLIEGSIPAALEAPTGLGKTSIIDCWTYALAVQASNGERTIPRRLFFVVDRRLIVDGAYEHAAHLKEALYDRRNDDGIVGDVARSLATLHGSDDPPVEVVRMRGGVSWESRWLARPDQAAVVTGTVDQFGSRLLFRGYGCSHSMQPINAALVGLDSWLVTDEAHLSLPLLKTISNVVDYQRLIEERRGFKPMRTTQMSATLPQDGPSNIDGETRSVLRIDAVSQMNAKRFTKSAEVASTRLTVSKPAHLTDLEFLSKSRNGKWKEDSVKFGEALAQLALSLSEAKVVAVVANTVSTARAAHRKLISEGEQAILLTGRVREFEREQILSKWLPYIKADPQRENPESSLFVVATQTIEAGADLDFDAMVTECAPLSCLIQRFGRVNRLGLRTACMSVVVRAGFTHESDPVYGEATSATWRYLAEKSSPSQIVNAKKVRAESDSISIDFGLQNVPGLVGDAPLEVNPTAVFVPVLTGAHLERWARTNPAPFPDQPVGPFLHGVDRDVPEVSVAWRLGPPNTVHPDEVVDETDAWKQWLEIAPPLEWEFVSIPIWEARALLADTPTETPLADVEGALQSEDDGAEARGESGILSEAALIGVVYRGPKDEPSPVRGPDDIGPGDRIVLRTDVGGHDEWGWTGRRNQDGEPSVADVGDLAPTRKRGVLRLAPSLISQFVPLEDIASLFSSIQPDDSETARSAIQKMAGLYSDSPIKGLLQSGASMKPIPTNFVDGETPIWLYRGVSLEGIDTAVSDDDESSSSQAGLPETIAAHCSKVSSMAAEFAAQADLPDQYANAIKQAALWHDLGKSEPRFQLMLHDGDPLRAAAALEPLAKSGRDPREPLARRASCIAHLPRGFRHEAVSARIVDSLCSDGISLDGIDEELVRHLVVSHHGKSRPLLPAIIDRSAASFTYSTGDRSVDVPGRSHQIDWAQPGRFERLCDEHGWWGLAFLEAVVRLADMKVSADHS